MKDLKSLFLLKKSLQQNSTNDLTTKLKSDNSLTKAQAKTLPNKRASLPVIITNASSDGVVFRKRVNHVGIDAVNDRRRSCPSRSQRTSLINSSTSGSHESARKKNNLKTHASTKEKKNDLTSDSQKMLANIKPPVKELPAPPVEDYSYAAVEFRPMLLTPDGAISTPINDKSKITDKKLGDTYSYAHVSLRPMVVGKGGAVSIPYDDTKTNDVDIKRNSIDHEEVNGDLYALVDKNNGTNGDILNNEKNITKRNTSSYDSVIPQHVSDEIQDLYAAINYSDKRRTSAEDVLAQSTTQFSDLRIRNNSRRVSDGMMNTPYFNTGTKKNPPSIPKPYGDRKWDLPTHIEEPSPISNGMRQRLESFNRNSVSTEDMLNSRLSPIRTYVSGYEDTDFKTITLLDPSDRLAKSQNTEELKQIKAFKKQHRRMRSHETVDRSFPSDLNFDPYNGKSSANISRGNSSSSLSNSKESEDDLLSDCHSVDMNDVIRKANELGPDDLPEGWQEVADGAETYYWHIWTGTIQYERPNLSATPSTSSRSDSPFSELSASSSRAHSASDAFDEKNVKNASPSPRPDTPVKQIISFPVHSMGWMNVEQELMGASIIGDTVNNCITYLADKRYDLWKTSETWAEGADIKLILEGETLKLYEPKTKTILHVQPIAKMRVWGVGRVESRDFAYIARDQVTGKHRCHMFRCHGHVSGRSITNALQAICNRVLDEKRRVKGRSDSSSARVSDLLKPPVKPSPTFNEKPYVEQKKCFTAKYVGGVDVSKSSGIDIINKVVANYSDQSTSDWSSVLVEVTTSEIKTIDCVKQQTTMEHRVRFVSFLGVAQDERFGAYIVAVAKDAFECHVFFCAPHAGTLTRAIEEACKLRFEKMLDGKVHSKIQPDQQDEKPQQKDVQIPQPIQQPILPQRGSVKEKTSKFLTSSIAGVFNKLNKKDAKKKDDPSTDSRSFLPGPNEHLVKYFGTVSVDIGTGIEAVQTAVKNLVGGEMMVGYLEVQSDCITLWDSQRTALSKRIFDLNTISYCGMTSDRKHFGIIVSRGKGKYSCHVFQEYKPNLGEIVHAIHEVL